MAEREEIAIDGESLDAAALSRIAAGHVGWLTDGARVRMDVGARWYDLRTDIDVVRQKTAWMEASGDDEAVSSTEEVPVQGFIEGHCAGVGEPLPPDQVRAIMAARANTLAVGLSGVRSEAVDVLLAMLYADVIPVVPSQGPVGAAGSTALAHIARVACGYGGEAWRRGVRKPADQAMKGLPVLEPTEKEALSLINGSTVGTALAALAVTRARRLVHAAEAACALTMEAVRADLRALSPLALDARRHPGAAAAGKRLRAFVDGSELVTTRRDPDSFSIRCAPTVFGAVWDALDHIEVVVNRELNAAGDNPLVFPAIEVIEAGNFHGAPVAMAMDHLRIALTHVATMSERRTYRLTYGDLSGLPSFLLPDSGVNSGLMLAQYTAASLVSECKGLAHPASVDTVPTVQHHEDHVSMAPIAARAAHEVLDILSDVIAIELLCAAQGLDFRIAGEAVDDAGQPVRDTPLQPGAGSRSVHDRVRQSVARWTDDRVLHTDLEALGDAVRQGVFSAD